MKWLKGIAGFVAILMMAAGCGVVSDTDNAKGRVSHSRVTLELPSGVSLKPNGQLLSVGKNLPAAKITSIDLTISAANMTTIKQNVPLTTLETTLDVPAGLMRTFAITAVTNAGLTFTGSQTVDLAAGASVDVIVSVGVNGLAPTAVTATAGSGQVTLAWDAVVGAASYNVYYGTSSGVTAANGTKTAGVASGSAITGLTNGTTYYFVVTAVNASGESAISSEVSATPQVPPPGIPTGVGATAGNAQVTINWTAATGATSYNIYYGTATGVTTGTGTKVTGATSGGAITGLTNGKAYYFIVTAVNAGGESAASSEVSATPQVPVPGAPASPAATAGNGQATITWAASSGAASYNIYYRTAAGVTSANGTKVAGATSGYVITGLTNGTVYYFIVTAVSAGGESAASSEVSVTPQPPIPAVPTGVTATGGNTQVTVSWTAPAGTVTSYNVYYGTATGVTTGTGTKVTGAVSGGSITGLTNGTTYYFIVTAVNGGGESAASAEIASRPGLPGPTGVTASSPVFGTIKVSWTSMGVTTTNISGSTTVYNVSGSSTAVYISGTATPTSYGSYRYTIYWSTTSGVTPFNAAGSFTDIYPSFKEHTGVTAATTYYYVVTAIDPTSGFESLPSAEASGMTGKIPKFAYVANQASNNVSVYSINSSTGALTAVGSPVAAGTGSYSIAIDPSGKFAYVANQTSNDISAYTINAVTGVLTAVSGSPFAAGTSPHSVTVDPTGKFAYAANQTTNDISMFTINQTTGALTPIGSIAAGTSPQSVVVDPTGKFAYVAGGSAGNILPYTINQTTCALTAGTSVAAGTSPMSVTVDPTGKFAYVANFSSNNVSMYTINQATGALTPIGSIAAGTYPNSVAVDPSGKFAYVANQYSTVSQVSVYTINQSTGALTAGTPVAAGTGPQAVTVDPSGKFAYVANVGSSDMSVFSINQSTGALTAVGTPVAAGTSPYSISIMGAAQ